MRPLDEARRRTLIVNSVHVLDRLQADSVFLTELARLKCITWPQTEHLIHISQPRDRNQKLLEFLTRRSVADLNNFTKVLAKEQAFLVPLLVTDGGETFCLILVNVRELSISVMLNMSDCTSFLC